jgi:hypothetical protein
MRARGIVERGFEMKRGMVAAALCAFAMAAGPLAAGLSGSGGGDDRKKETMTSDAKSRVVTGTVTDYKAGKWLVIRTETNGNETFKLDDSDLKVRMDPNVAVGSKVSVTERVDGGTRTLTVAPV